MTTVCRTVCAMLGWMLVATLAMPSVEAEQISNAPTSGGLTSAFGWRSDPFSGQRRFHAGIDIAAPSGAPVYVPQDGVVVYSGRYKGYGNVVVVQHDQDLYTLYGHNAELLVVPGQSVRRGQLIALVGSTGRSTGPHLHFEVHQNGRYVDPLDYLAYLEQANLPYLAQGTLVAPSSPLSTSGMGDGSEGVSALAVVSRQGTVVDRRPRKTSGRTMEVIRGNSIEVLSF